MKLQVYTTSSESLKSIKESIAQRLCNLQCVIGRELSEKTGNEVKNRIPTLGGWFSIYKNAIQFREHELGDSWVVAGLSEIKLSDPPANETLISFSGSDVFSKLLNAYNPWPVDFIPPIASGYADNVVARKVNVTEVNSSRSRLTPLLPGIRAALETAGATLGTEAELPTIKGKVYADLVYLARRLELGYTGFMHVPHWSPSVSKLESNANSWVETPEIVERGNNVLCGSELPTVATISQAESEALSKIRNNSWP